MIIVTGAGGQLGRSVVEQLLQRIPADRIGVSVRSPDKAADLAERGIRVRQGDFAAPAALAHAFEDATQVLIVSVDATGKAAVSRHAAAIEAAKSAGARRLLYTSHMGVNPASPFLPMPDHAATEELLRASEIPFTSLRNGFYATTALQLVGQALETGKLHTPQDGPVSWTTHADLAEAAAITLADEGRFDGPTPPLTASQALDLTAVAKIASEITGREIEHITVPDEEWKANLIAHAHVPEEQADLLLGLFAASRQGEFAGVDPTLEKTLGREPITLRQFLADRLTG
ncbi:NAD(P)H-binding protein [Streptomyces sp. A5-4]|uniref:NAD(P)H-binding protein n=1 Tax=Streptomyces sp. A5-4 TaxID=3384771 RepID=UPI003DA9ED5F